MGGIPCCLWNHNTQVVAFPKVGPVWLHKHNCQDCTDVSAWVINAKGYNKQPQNLRVGVRFFSCHRLDCLTAAFYVIIQAFQCLFVALLLSQWHFGILHWIPSIQPTFKEGSLAWLCKRFQRPSLEVVCITSAHTLLVRMRHMAPM